MAELGLSPPAAVPPGAAPAGAVPPGAVPAGSPAATPDTAPPGPPGFAPPGAAPPASPATAAPDAAAATGDSLARAAVTVARRFAAGATMWCVAPQWPAHARHVAVEFVHPVIVGKRALPAVAVGAGPGGYAAALRLLVRPGDVLVVVGPADEGNAALVARAEAWGVTSLWLGAGPRPGPVATHVVWVDSPPGPAARSGEIVVLYHLLWELTHVVFEHPGLLSDPAGMADAGPACITCADEGRVAEIRSERGAGQAEVLAGGRRETIDVTLVEPVRAGDVVLVHAGVAIEVLSRQEAGSR